MARRSSSNRTTLALTGDLGEAGQLLQQFQEQVQAAVQSMEAAGKAAAAAILATAKQNTTSIDEEVIKLTASIQKAIAPLSSTLAKGFVGLAEGTKSVKQVALSLGQTLLEQEINNGTRLVTNWLAMEAAKTAATVGGVSARTGAQVAGAAAGKVAQDTAAHDSILTSAKQAASGAYAAVAGIPYVGPILAPAAAAAAFAGVLAFDIASAAGGFGDVPVDDMPALLHKNEMVLPASIANPLRNSLAGGGGFGGGDTHHYHVNYAPKISGNLTRSQFETALRDHSSVLTKMIANAARPGGRP